MFKKYRLRVLLVTTFASAHAFAAIAPTSVTEKDFMTEGNNKVHTQIPAGWSAVENYLSIPVALLSEKGKQDQRSVIEIIPYGVQDTNDDLAKLKKDPEEYYSQKEDWLDQVKGDSISYLPYEETKKDGATIYSVGIKYKIDQGEFMDKTFYVSTKSKQLYYIKSMVPLDQLAEHADIVADVVNTISAKN